MSIGLIDLRQSPTVPEVYYFSLIAKVVVHGSFQPVVYE